MWVSTFDSASTLLGDSQIRGLSPPGDFIAILYLPQAPEGVYADGLIAGGHGLFWSPPPTQRMGSAYF